MKALIETCVVIVVVLISALASQAQWTQLQTGVTTTLNEIFFASRDVGFAVGDSGTLLRTTDAGINWTHLDLATKFSLNDVYFMDQLRGYVVGDSGLLSRTTDGGDTWTTIYLTNVGDVQLSSVCFLTPELGFVGGKEGFVQGMIFKTTDGGLNWSVPNIPTSQMDVDFVRIVFPTSTIGYAITRGMCLKTTDEGANWFVTDSALVESGGMFSILEDAFFFSADTGYVVGWYGPFCGYTTNGGDSWADKMVANNQWRSIDFPSVQVGYMVGWGQMVRTTDAGQTWLDITEPPVVMNNILSMDFTDENTGYVCGDKGVIYKITNALATSVEETIQQQNVSMFPNPAARSASIKVECMWLAEFSISVVNVNGRTVFTSGVSTNSQVVIPAGILHSGVYSVQILSDGVPRGFVKLLVE